jgi:hypothetical protein
MFFSEDLQRVVLIDFGSSEDLSDRSIRKNVEATADPRRVSHVNFVGTP